MCCVLGKNPLPVITLGDYVDFIPVLVMVLKNPFVKDALEFFSSYNNKHRIDQLSINSPWLNPKRK